MGVCDHRMVASGPAQQGRSSLSNHCCGGDAVPSAAFSVGPPTEGKVFPALHFCRSSKRVLKEKSLSNISSAAGKLSLREGLYPNAPQERPHLK